MKPAEFASGEDPPPQADVPAAVPAAEPVERGRFVLHLHDRDEDSVASNADNVESGNTANASAPDSPKSFNSDEIFEDVEQIEEQTSDQDLERLLGPLPLRRTNHVGGEHGALGSLEVDGGDGEDVRRRRPKKAFCPCCPAIVRRGPCQLFLSMTGHDGSMPSTRVGNMILVFPKCFHRMGFGIMGPHWVGPICCFGLLTGATAYFAPKAHNVGPISAITCLIFYSLGVASLLVVSCSDPGVVRADSSGKNGYAGLPTDLSARRGWRYCDMCSVYQPPGAVHCPECNVCIEGYDHHCPWMGTCIGGKNFTAFMAFNITWLFYLFYAIIWVTFVGATFSEGTRDVSSED